MRKLFIATLPLTIVLLFAIPSLAQDQRGPSTPQERETAIKAARLLETDPFHKDAKNIRAWFFKWLVEVPDVHIDYALRTGARKRRRIRIMGLRFSRKRCFRALRSSSSIRTRRMIGQPWTPRGLEGALKVYENVLTTKPKAKSAFWDGLVEKRNKGELRAFAEETANTKCKSKV